MKSLKLPVLLGFFIGCGLIFNACTTSKNGTRIKVDKYWVNWKFQIKPGTSDEEITQNKAVIDKYITNYINKIDPGHKAILVVTNTFLTDYSDNHTGPEIIVQVKIGYASQGGIRAPVPPAPPPVMPGFDFTK